MFDSLYNVFTYVLLGNKYLFIVIVIVKFVNLLRQSVLITENALYGKIWTSGIKYVTHSPWRPVNMVLWFRKSLDNKKHILSKQKWNVVYIHRIY